jgi:hypothetical protein
MIQNFKILSELEFDLHELKFIEMHYLGLNNLVNLDLFPGINQSFD